MSVGVRRFESQSNHCSPSNLLVLPVVGEGSFYFLEEEGLSDELLVVS